MELRAELWLKSFGLPVLSNNRLHAIVFIFPNAEL